MIKICCCSSHSTGTTRAREKKMNCISVCCVWQRRVLKWQRSLHSLASHIWIAAAVWICLDFGSVFHLSIASIALHLHTNDFIWRVMAKRSLNKGQIEFSRLFSNVIVQICGWFQFIFLFNFFFWLIFNCFLVSFCTICADHIMNRTKSDLFFDWMYNCTHSARYHCGSNWISRTHKCPSSIRFWILIVRNDGGTTGETH